MKGILTAIFLVAGLSWLPATAHDGNSELVEELIVYGRSQEVIGIADQDITCKLRRATRRADERLLADVTGRGIKHDHSDRRPSPA